MKEHYTTLPPKQKYLSLNETVVQGENARNYKFLPPIRFQGVPYTRKPEHRKTFYAAAKRGLDVSVSIAIIVFALPLIAGIVIAVKMTSRGPVIFRHRRLGKNGEEFDCFKFRTMVSDAEEQLKKNAELQKQFSEKFKIANDPRITRIGHFLRKTSLDELPQLLQVVQGKMSLIGPRPIVAGEVEKYSIYADKLFSVTPGLSGLWQTSGRSDTTYNERVLLDMYYIDNRSLRLELQLMAMTVATVVKKSGAY